MARGYGGGRSYVRLPHPEQEEAEGTEGEGLAEMEGPPRTQAKWQETVDFEDAKAEKATGSVFKSVSPPPPFFGDVAKHSAGSICD